jgi:hypothetical protein
VWSGGGGGGAGAAGTAATGSPRSGGAGGNGAASSITGTSVMYAGGGGGSTDTTASGTAGRGGTGGGGAGAVLGWNFHDIKDIGLRWRVHDISGVAVSDGGSTTAAPATTAEFDYLIANSGSATASGRADVTNQNSGGTLSVNILNWMTSLELQTAMRATAGNNESASPPNWIDDNNRHNNFAVVVEGKFVPKETGTYTFTLDSDDASDLFIDTNTSGAYSGSPVMSYYGGRGLQGLGNTGSGQANTVGTVSLTAGTVYRFRVRQMERSGGEGLRLFWKKPSQSGGSAWYQDPEEMPGAFAQTSAEFTALLAGLSDTSGTGEIVTQNVSTNTRHILNWTTSAELQTALRTDPQRSDYSVPNSGSDFAVVVAGTFVPSESGVYTFSLSGDDAVELSLDGTVVVSHYGDHSAASVGSITGVTASLTKGQTYRLQARHQQRSGGAVLRVFWRKPSQGTGWFQDAKELTGRGHDGEPNTGGGGGAGGYFDRTNTDGGAGGSGVVILRYPVSAG